MNASKRVRSTILGIAVAHLFVIGLYRLTNRDPGEFLVATLVDPLVWLSMFGVWWSLSWKQRNPWGEAGITLSEGDKIMAEMSSEPSAIKVALYVIMTMAGTYAAAYCLAVVSSQLG